MKKAGAKLGDLKIQGVLKQEGGLKGIKGSRWTKIKQEIKVTKMDHPVCQTGLSGFPRT
jgi:hypothetical protein